MFGVFVFGRKVETGLGQGFLQKRQKLREWMYSQL
jgi:hypothetical protein